MWILQLDHADAPGTQTSGMEDVEVKFSFLNYTLFNFNFLVNL